MEGDFLGMRNGMLELLWEIEERIFGKRQRRNGGAQRVRGEGEATDLHGFTRIGGRRQETEVSFNPFDSFAESDTIRRYRFAKGLQMTVQTLTLGKQKFVVILEKDFRRLQEKAGASNAHDAGDSDKEVAMEDRRDAAIVRRRLAEMRRRGERPVPHAQARKAE
jgi:hypothetical protein